MIFFSLYCFGIMPTVQFDFVYEPGTLEAISYTDGKRVSSDVLVSAGKPVGIRIIPDKKELAADGQSLVHAVLEIIDEFGRLVPTAEMKSSACVEGAATLAAFGFK
jgi:beta-galactosidase